MGNSLSERMIIIKGAGEMATGVACRLFRANFRRILMLEIASPRAVRRTVSFCEAVYDQSSCVEGVEAVKVADEDGVRQAWEDGRIALMVDPRSESVALCRPDILIDATVSKRNSGISRRDAPLVIALGPGYTAGADCHVVIETNRGHNLGRVITSGMAEANSGIPGDIAGYTSERVVRAPADGIFTTMLQIGDHVRTGEEIARIGTAVVTATIGGILRGLIRPGSAVTTGLKIGDIDPRGEAGYCDTISEKARSLGGAVLEAVLAAYNRS